MKDAQDILEKSAIHKCWWMRYVLLGFGSVCTILGFIGFFVPVMPSTIFFIIALWAFSKSSVRLHMWLYTHERFGRGLREWHQHRVIPVKAKWSALCAMTVSVAIVALFVAESWMLPTMITVILAPIALYILTRRSHTPSV